MSQLPYNPGGANLGGSDTRELYLKEYDALLYHQFAIEAKVYGRIAKSNVNSGKTHQTLRLTRAEAYGHAPGSDLSVADAPVKTESNIQIDNQATVSNNYVPEVDAFVAQYDVRAEYAQTHGPAVARLVDSRTLRKLAEGARQPESTNSTGPKFDSGVLVQRNDTDEASAYPFSLQGSYNAQEDLAALQQSFDERNLPDQGRVAIISPRMARVLRYDNAIQMETVSDPSNPNMKLQRITTLVEGFELIISNNLPNGFTYNSTGGTASTKRDTESAYHGDFTKTAILAMALPIAVQARIYHDIRPIGPEWLTQRQAWVLGAKWFGGLDWVLPEACGEVYVDTSAYTESNGVFGPAS